MNEETIKSKKRVSILQQLNILDTVPEEEYDDITKLTAYICDVPIALITLIDDKKQWFMSKIGTDINEMSIKDVVFCNYTISQNVPYVVNNTLYDDRFNKNTLIIGAPHLRFYAGAQIKVENENIGTLCIMDSKPKNLSDKQIESLVILSKHVSILITYRKYKMMTEKTLDEMKILFKDFQIKEETKYIKSSLLSNLSHEITTPVNGIVGCIDSLEEIMEDKDSQVIKTLRACTDDISNVVTNWMDISESIITLRNEQINLVIFFQNIYNNFQYKATEKLIDFVYENQIVKDTINKYDTICSDTTRLNVIVSNLLSNAIKFTNPRGKVKITVDISKTYKKDELFLYIRVDDTGVGIPEEFARTMFEPLNQQNISSTKTHRGVGNGLAITKMIVDAMKGQIDYSSKINEGSSFRVLIPVEKGIIVKQLTRLKKILVVDDNELNLKIASTLIRKIFKDIDIEIAKDGLVAVNKIRTLMNKNAMYDLILMDCQMPVMDGFTATNEIRKMDSKIIILALTASLENSDFEKCLRVGMNDVITKPITMVKLKNAFSKFF